MKDIINYAAKNYGDSVAFKYKISKNQVETRSYNDLKNDNTKVYSENIEITHKENEIDKKDETINPSNNEEQVQEIINSLQTN